MAPGNLGSDGKIISTTGTDPSTKRKKKRRAEIRTRVSRRHDGPPYVKSPAGRIIPRLAISLEITRPAPDYPTLLGPPNPKNTPATRLPSSETLRQTGKPITPESFVHFLPHSLVAPTFYHPRRLGSKSGNQERISGYAKACESSAKSYPWEFSTPHARLGKKIAPTTPSPTGNNHVVTPQGTARPASPPQLVKPAPPLPPPPDAPS